MSISTENFIKTIYKLQQGIEGSAKPGNIAAKLNITNAAATDMARKLAVKGLVEYQKYKALKLTEPGKKMALKVLRKHRLWETFLYRTFNLSLHEIHCEAERLEHQTSDFLANKISEHLNNPAYDPHGDPIPGTNGELIPAVNAIQLSKALPNKLYEVVRLFGSDKDFFNFCENNQLKVGDTIEVKQQYTNNGMTEILCCKQKLLLNSGMTNFIYVKQVNNK